MNKNNIKIKDVIVSGFALFAIFFGAGNLILPPLIGLNAGSAWIPAWIGFSLSGPILTGLGMVAMAKNQGDAEKFAQRVGHKFSIVLGSALILCIGPLMAVPRTGATTFEVSILPFFPSFSPILFSLLFFGVTLYFSLNKTKTIDIIGTYMTPVLTIILMVIILKGIFTPMDLPSIIGKKSFSLGFLEGYNTMDALAPMVLAGMIISNFKEKGINSKRELTRYTIYTELIAATGLTLIYGGLIYLGAKLSPVITEDLTRTELLNFIVNFLLGEYGSIFLSLVVALACITTSIGLTIATGDFFNKVSQGKLKYKYVVAISVLVSAILAVIGVDRIIAFSIPILITIYPVIIVLTFLNLFDGYVKDDLIYKTSIYATLIVGVVLGLEAGGFKDLAIVELFSNLPLWDLSFGWIPFTLVGLIIGVIFSKIKKRDGKRL